MIIGLTGSIASGKSTVANLLKDRGYPIVDADEIARLIVEPGSDTLEKVRATFGDEVILPDGQLNRKKLGAIIFNDEVKRKHLNAIMHPAVREEMLRQKDAWLARGAKTIIMDIPLLFESQLQAYVDRILVVSVTRQNQKKRLMARNHLTETEAEARISSQIPMADKEQGADAVIDNNGSLTATEQQLDQILEAWKTEPLF